MTTPATTSVGYSHFWVAGWSVIAVGLIAFSHLATGIGWFLVPTVMILWGLTGIVLLIALLVRRHPRNAIALVLITTALLVFWAPINALGDRLSFSIMLRSGSPAYAQVVADPNLFPRRGTSRGLDYIVDDGPPRRVAFISGGLLDNWTGVVYDPTDRVVEAKGWDRVSGELTAPEDIKGLFGGDLVQCRRITGHWYRCSFT